MKKKKETERGRSKHKEQENEDKQTFRSAAVWCLTELSRNIREVEMNSNRETDHK